MPCQRDRGSQSRRCNLRKIIEAGIATAARFSKEETNRRCRKSLATFSLAPRKAKVSLQDAAEKAQHSPAMQEADFSRVEQQCAAIRVEQCDPAEEAVASAQPCPNPM